MDITLIPGVMRTQMGWDKAPALMERWFNARPSAGTPDRTTITMAWARTFPRAMSAFQTLVANHSWFTTASKDSLVNWLRSQRKLTSNRTTFGIPNFATATPTRITDATIHTQSVGSISDPLDDMYGALGEFDFRVLAWGQVDPVRGMSAPSVGRPTKTRGTLRSVRQHQITISHIGIYIWDTFDFNDHQFLGFWTPSGVARHPPVEDVESSIRDPVFFPAPGPIPIPVPAPNPARLADHAITNGHFRRWRTANGMGGDFLIFSDMRVVHDPMPGSFLV